MSLLDEVLEEDYKSGYEFENCTGDEKYKMVTLYRKKDNMTKFIFYDETNMSLDYAEMNGLNIKNNSLGLM